jgi:hypothetical protein
MCPSPHHETMCDVVVCIRDNDGSFVLAKTMWIRPLCNADVGEAFGLLHVHDLQLEGVDFVLDLKKVVDCFHKGRNNVSEFCDIVIEFKNKFGLFFENSRVKFNERQTNEVADALARVATCITCSNIFLLMYPLVNTYKIFLDGQETNESHLVKGSFYGTLE